MTKQLNVEKTTLNTFEGLIAIIERLDTEDSAEYIAKCDVQGVFPVQLFDVLKDEGFLSAMIPRAYGGLELSFSAYQKILIRLAKLCPALAATYNMHNIVVGGLAAINLQKLPERRQKRVESYLAWVFSLVVEERAVFAAATTEPGIGARFSQTKTQYTHLGDQYVISGKKSFVSMANQADYYIVLAKHVDEMGSNTSDTLTYFLVPRKIKGVDVSNDWNTFAMRSTDSCGVSFDNVLIDKKYLFMQQEGFALNKVLREPYWVSGGYIGVYMGMMEYLLEFTVEYIKKRTDNTKKAGLGFQPLIQARVADMYTLVESARALLFKFSNSVDANPSCQQTTLQLYTAKYYVMEKAVELASVAIRTCGGSVIQKSLRFEMYFRDIQCGRLMPAVSDVCQLSIARQLLGLYSDNLW